MTVLERRPKVADVAARAGVSTATVDRVINGRGGVHQKTVARVEEAIREIVGGVAAARRRGADATLRRSSFRRTRGRSTEVLAEAFPRVGAARGANADIVSSRRMNPAALADRLLRLRAARQRRRRRSRSLDHPLVREAVDELARAGIPVVTCARTSPSVDRLAYIGSTTAPPGAPPAS